MHENQVLIRRGIESLSAPPKRNGSLAREGNCFVPVEKHLVLSQCFYFRGTEPENPVISEEVFINRIPELRTI